MKKSVLLFACFLLFALKNQAQTVTDFDGNVYDTIHIGSQVWLKQNLKVTHYSNGDSIPNVKDATAWSNLTTGAYCDYNNIPDSSTIYGKLYNYYSAEESRNLCPSGWHVPIIAEWTILSDYLGNMSIAGGKLKETGFAHWNSPNTGATNETDFTALPAGYRSYDGGFIDIGTRGYFWSSTWHSTGYAWLTRLFNDYIDLSFTYFNMKIGLSIRCLMNTPTQINKSNNPEEIKIYPNPAIERIYINHTGTQDFKIQILNTIGWCVIQKELNIGSDEINISSLSKGIYIIKLIGTNGNVYHTFIKE